PAKILFYILKEMEMTKKLSKSNIRVITVAYPVAKAATPGSDEVEIVDINLYIHSIMLRNHKEVINCAGNPNVSTPVGFSIFDNHDDNTGVVLSPKEGAETLHFSLSEPSSLETNVAEKEWDIFLIHISCGDVAPNKISTITYIDPVTGNEKEERISNLPARSGGGQLHQSYGLIVSCDNAIGKIPDYPKYKDNAKKYLGDGKIQELYQNGVISTQGVNALITLQLNTQGILKKDTSGKVYIDVNLLESYFDTMSIGIRCE
ncbi:MAG: hypothetical protein FWG13_01880, partial [Leptospirales bacterium]|nr:hypothetical protein [Leptospirales bacterium]